MFTYNVHTPTTDVLLLLY